MQLRLRFPILVTLLASAVLGGCTLAPARSTPPTKTLTPAAVTSPSVTLSPTVTATFTPSPLPPTATATATPSPTFTPSATATASPSPTVTPGPPVFRQGQIVVRPGDVLNFDDGTSDVEVSFAEGNFNLGHIGDHVYFHGPWYIWPLDMADCYHAPYNPKRNALIGLQRMVGFAFCYRTEEGRVGALHIESVDVNTPQAVITFVTWAVFIKLIKP